MVHYAAAFKALGDVTRLAILEQVAMSPVTISTLAQTYEMSLSGAMKHVRILEDAGLIETRKTGRKRTCYPRSDGLIHVTTWMDQHRLKLTERFDHLEQLLEALESEEAS